jgi:hypothetical protein
MIDIYCSKSDQYIIDRVKKLSSDFFNIIVVDDVEKIDTKRGDVSIVLVDFDHKKEYSDKFLSKNTVVLINGEGLDLKTGTLNKIPKDLFMTAYLEEFLYWVLQRAQYERRLKNRNTRTSKKVQTLLDELHTLSRSTTLTNQKIQGMR